MLSSGFSKSMQTGLRSYVSGPLIMGKLGLPQSKATFVGCQIEHGCVSTVKVQGSSRVGPSILLHDLLRLATRRPQMPCGSFRNRCSLFRFGDSLQNRLNKATCSLFSLGGRGNNHFPKRIPYRSFLNGLESQGLT